MIPTTRQSPVWRRARAAGLLLLGLALAGCAVRSAPDSAAAPTRLIVLQNPESGRIVPCGPPPGAVTASPAAEAESCAQSYERLGYRRLRTETNQGS